MKTEDLIDAYMEVNQDEEIYREDVYSMYVGQDDETDPNSPTNVDKWIEIRVLEPYSLELEDLNWIRRILHEKSGRGTGYGVRKYMYPDYFSGLSIWVPDAWQIENYLSYKLWENKPVVVLGPPELKKIKVGPTLDLAKQIALKAAWWTLFGPILGEILWCAFQKQTLQESFQEFYEQVYVDLVLPNSEWRNVILQLQYWNYNDMTYYGELLMNFFPWINRLDEAIQMFINMPYPIWENISFENTTPNEVLYANWDKCVRDLDIYFGLTDPKKSESSGWTPHGTPVTAGGTDQATSDYYWSKQWDAD